MTVPVTYDLTRLLLRGLRGGPNGIDRVDRNLARHFLHHDAPGNVGVLLNALRPITVRQNAAQSLLDTVDNAWGADRNLADDPHYHAVRNALLMKPEDRGAPLARVIRPADVRIATALRMASTLLPRLAIVQPSPPNAVFIHTTQFPSIQQFRWLDRRLDIKPVFFVHDLLPLRRPTFFTAENTQQHRDFLEVFLQFAHAAIVNTEVVKAELQAFIRERGSRTRPVLVAPMPAETLFMQPELKDAALQTNPYFVMCGTIEPRKNHRMILDLWQSMVRADGPAAPRLVIIGRRGWNNVEVIEKLDGASWAKSHIIEASNLTSQAMAALVANARALLMPSFAEGYGFPIVEALAARTPVIASDILVFREIQNKNIAYCDVHDKSAWLSAINSHLSHGNEAHESQSYSQNAMSWDDYFEKVDSFIEDI